MSRTLTARVLAGLALLLGVVLVAGCGSGGPAAAPGFPGSPRPARVVQPPPVAKVSFQPGDGATDVNPTAPVSATVAEGTFDTVSLVNPAGEAVQGELSADRRTWTAGEPLGYGKTYTFRGTATGTDGRQVPVAGAFSTVTPTEQIGATINIGDGQKVGIAAPIIIQFSGHVADKAAVERALQVQTSVPTTGSWAWLQDQNGGSRVHWRPQEYWTPGTVVDLTAKLYGVPYGDGAYGAEDLSTHFTIGRSQIVKADTKSHQMVVIRDGREVARYNASYGLDSDPNRNTRSGIHVVTEKFTDVRMVSRQYGYDVIEKWAVRISDNGEFIHANPATVGVQGQTNVSHGCVNLSTADAKAYYDSVLYGDPVEVTNSGVALSPRDGDIFDWAIPWSEWQSLSALT